MRTPVKLGVFAAGLVAVFGAVWGVGGALGAASSTGAMSSPAPSDGHDHGGHGGQAVTGVPGGLEVTRDGFTIEPERTVFTPGETADFRFIISGFHGMPITGYEELHEKRMHLIVVSRDLGEFLHLHPELGKDGVWSVPLKLPRAGTYRAFADFAPYGVAPMTLGVDLWAGGDFAPEPLPEPGRVARVGDYTVTMMGDLVPGRSSKVTMFVTRDGEPVTDLEPYLGARGHLVALRAGDLAYLHVHPEEARVGGPGVTFHAEVPSAGTYRLFLDFKHDGRVRTAALTARTRYAAHSH